MPAESPVAPDRLGTVLDEITQVVARVSRPDISRMAERLAGGRRVFAAGEGRSGLMAKAFAMRLMHLGVTVYAIGESTTPAVGAGDILVAISGSGATEATVRTAAAGRRAGASVLALTTDPTSALADVAEDVLVLPAATKYRRPDEAHTIQPLSSLFDQVTHIALDVICLELADHRKIDNETARRTHSNTE